MLNKKGMAMTMSALLITLNSNVILAADNADTSSIPPYWPLLALAFIVIVFRKQLNCVPAPDLTDKPSAEKTAPKKAKKTPVPSPSSSTKNIDLKDGSEQCQASTTKGTRCKRTSTLEDTNISINDTTYQLTVCKQHNTKKLKPFAKLLK